MQGPGGPGGFEGQNEQSLPQAQQEGLETVIGLVAVVMVTGMIVWMRHHARHLKSELETAAVMDFAGGFHFQNEAKRLAGVVA